MVAPITTEFVELAQEMIDEFIPSPNTVWVSQSENAVADPLKPFMVTKPTETSYNVKILFARDDLEDRQFYRYRKDTSMADGQINGWMYKSASFTPKLKDTVKFNGDVLTVNAIDPIQPVDGVILYFLEFGS